MSASVPREQTPSTGCNGSGTEVVGALLATLPPLTNFERQAFRAQFTHAECDVAGELADGALVLRHAIGWARPIERTLARRPWLVRRYGRTRFAWLLECTRDLGEAMQIRRAGDPMPGPACERRDRVLRAARRIREELVDAIAVLVASDDEERERLSTAAGGADEDLVASLQALARLAEDWMEREGPLTRALVASVDLTRADVEAARTAAHAALPAIEGSACHHDFGATGRAEGRVVLEMRVAKRFFERARAWDPRVPALPSEPEMRAALCR